MVARGFAVVVADGVGMGVHIPSGPEFANRLSAGTGLLDAARAAMKLPGHRWILMGQWPSGAG